MSSESRGQKTRKQILGRALSAVSIDGLDGLTIGNLATAVGMSKSGLFAHFRSKEQLQLEVLREATDRFVSTVITPAIQQPRGVPRVVELFERWLDWVEAPYLPGGCPFVAAAVELDDHSGPVRDFLEQSQQEWLATLARAARVAVEERHFHRSLDPDQFAFELHSLMLGYHFHARLLRRRGARERVEVSFAHLVERSRHETSHNHDTAGMAAPPRPRRSPGPDQPVNPG